MINQIFKISDHIRYVAIYKDGILDSKEKNDIENTSCSESDRYEELLVNPTLLTLARQRGDIDCGGLDHIVIRYGNFYQLILPINGGHISICIESTADPHKIAGELKSKIGIGQSKSF